jgi:hypothetical protein
MSPGKAVLASLLVVAAASPAAQADVGETPAPSPPQETAIAPPERTFLFTYDPSLPAQGHLVVSAGMGNVSRTGEERPVGAGEIMPAVGVEVGVVSRLSLYVDSAFTVWPQGTKGVSPFSVEAGPRILLTDPHSREFFVTLVPAWALDFWGNSALQLTAAFAWNYRILRVAASATASHTFQTGADPADVQATIGASVRLPLGFLVGLEGVVTDLEEIATPADEGGPSAFAGPTLGWSWEHRFQVVAGPAYGRAPSYTGDARTGLLARLAASAQF